MSQDAKQGFDGKWAFNKYDAFGRLVITGVTTNNVSRANWAVIINADTTVMSEERSDSNPNGTGYTNQKQPSVGLADCMNIIYYDDYGFYGNTGGYAPQSVISGKLKGMVTGVRSRVINGAMLLSVGYYDDEGRMVETVEDNHLGGKDRVLLRYNFAGELLNTVRTHTDGVATTSVANAYTYDQMGRSILTKQNINNDGGITLSRLGYNELGQPREKSLHSTDNGSTFKQSTQYAYNERGWLKSSRSPQFSYKLGYDTLGSGIARYNGDISIKQWGSENSYPNKFLYGYDGMDRLTSAVSTGVAMSETLTYNAMGNIATLTRDGVTGTYNYNGAGNRLNLISGGSMATNSYSYDQRGRVTTDGRTGFSLTYNNLGLTHTANKASAGVYHSYVHDAMGNRLSRTVVTPADTTVSDYLGGIHYTNGEIEFIQTEEGRAIKSGDKYVYQYDLSDYLGNVRYSFDIYEGSVRRLQGDDYYAFGLRKPVSPVSLDNRYLYNGKELQEHLGQYDYGARFYDPSIGRWLATDPLTELAPSLTPFRYGFNSPVNYT
ncbi:MAG: RHS repeat-associated core domain-containing protein, partial [Pedobacter sp.]